MTQVFFGPEDAPDARFVELVDCQHLVHAESMDQWVEQAGPEGVVKLAECPICKTPVRSTARYNSAVNSHLLNVEKVKAKLRGEVRLQGSQLSIMRHNSRKEQIQGKN